ncbi:hypothetical protein [Brevundimonas aurifodinae]|uniref:DUF3887 domain-containing protein n=2 Tax=Brevundimonas TaxID=41275 RepID=A0ABV1NR44_9CAUL|nr:MAG: hypothetical protein B7Z42_07950 [Brevundimonas sp. 12-68-7]OYX33103.1 MAG: hypothetical protein B7Z01_09415 [Brevundimonas subvibrioides]
MIRPSLKATTLLTASLLALATPVLAQTAAPVQSPQTRSLAPASTPAPVAAATLPNSFDSPVTRTAPPSAPIAMPSAGQVTEADVAEGLLRAVIADLAAGRIEADLFTPDLAGRLTPQLAQLQPLVQGFGALGPIAPQGVVNGANQFLVTFDNAETQWVIGLNEDGRISALLFRPAPPVSSEPEAEAEPETDAQAAEPMPTEGR